MRIFIAGPCVDTTPKDVIAKNVAIADQWARRFMSLGHQVYCPHKMSQGWEDDKTLTQEQFLELDKSFLRHWAQSIFRIPGESPGADGEVALAKELKLPIYRPDLTHDYESDFFIIPEEYPYGSAC